MTTTATATIQPRSNRPLVHRVRSFGLASMYGRVNALTACGQRLTGWPSSEGTTPTTCRHCKER